MGDGAQGVQYHAGIVTADEKLTKQAVNLFIEDIKKELTLGSKGYTPIFPCGPDIAANPFAEQLNLEDETAFPEFHKQVVHGQYETIAAALNLAGGFTILPICDPFALAVKLGADFSFTLDFPDGFLEFLIPNLPKLALGFNMMPPFKLAAKLPGLLTVPPSIPKLSLPPIPNPQLDFVPGLNADLQFALKLPQVLLSIIAQIPSLVLNLPNLPSAICKIVFSSGLFTPIPDAIVRVVAYKILVRKISEMLMLLAVGKVIGSAPNGVVGGLGTKLGYTPPVVKQTAQKNSPRDKIVQYANDCVDLSWGAKKDEYTQRLLYTEYGDGQPKDTLAKDDPEHDARVIGKNKAIAKTSELSSCGMLARACCFSGGARYYFKYKGQPLLNKNDKISKYYDFFADEYRLINGSGIAINGILQAARTKNATIPVIKRDLPALHKGDIIIVYDPLHNGREHVMILVEDYKPGSFKLTTVEGGQIDPKNKNKPTAIRKKQYTSATDQDYANKKNPLDPPYLFEVTNSGVVKLSGRQIYAIIDGEKLCTSQEGTDSTDPGQVVSDSIQDNNDPQADLNSGFLPPKG